MAIFNSYVELPEGNQQHVSRRPASLGALTHQHENFGNTHTHMECGASQHARRSPPDIQLRNQVPIRFPNPTVVHDHAMLEPTCDRYL